MKELVLGLAIGAALGLVCVHGSVKRTLCRVCIDPSICQHVHDRCRGEEEDAMRRERYGFMA